MNLWYFKIFKSSNCRAVDMLCIIANYWRENQAGGRGGREDCEYLPHDDDTIEIWIEVFAITQQSCRRTVHSKQFQAKLINNLCIWHFNASGAKHRESSTRTLHDLHAASSLFWKIHCSRICCCLLLFHTCAWSVQVSRAWWWCWWWWLRPIRLYVWLRLTIHEIHTHRSYLV